MSGRTWLLMMLVLGINWGGFVALLIYGALRQQNRQPPERVDPENPAA